MARERAHGDARRGSAPVLQVRDLHVYYGQSHALQGVDVEVPHGVHAIVGRNGMGKSTLCNAILGMLPVRRGTVRFEGADITGHPSHRIAARGIGYCPQGRRLWPSLTVDEHLALADAGGAWSVERVYDTFPRLAERRGNGGAELSGGEQQMLAIGRALLQDPRLLVLDEPTEGLAPVIVDQVAELLGALGEEGDVAILLIEQNISVATGVAEDVGIMVNGCISRTLPAAELAGDRALQQRLLGVGRHGHEEDDPTGASEPGTARRGPPAPEEPAPDRFGDRPAIAPTRWAGATIASGAASDAATGRANASRSARAGDGRPFDAVVEPLWREPAGGRFASLGAEVVVAGTWDTKGEELGFLRERLIAAGVATRSVDLSTAGRPSSADVPPHLVAAYHPRGAAAVLAGDGPGDRGAANAAMGEAFARWMLRQPTPAGILSAGGSGGTALVAPGMRALPIGVPKVLVSTVASGDVSAYVGASDLLMMYSVTDVQGLNRISRDVLGNAAAALAGMVLGRRDARGDGSSGAAVRGAGTGARGGSGRRRGAAQGADDLPAVGLTMFGVTTPAVQRLAAALEGRAEPLVFHATGTGGRSMEKLADSGLLDAAIDLTTTEVADLLVGGVFAATEDRFGAFARHSIPWVGSVGALDMVNFGARATVPERHARRRFVEHNPQVTLMRTTAEENRAMGAWIAERLNRMTGPVRLLVPEGGVSALDAPGEPFHDPEANAALFRALAENVVQTGRRRLLFLPHHVNDVAFTDAVLEAFHDVAGHLLATRGSRRVS